MPFPGWTRHFTLTKIRSVGELGRAVRQKAAGLHATPPTGTGDHWSAPGNWPGAPGSPSTPAEGTNRDDAASRPGPSREPACRQYLSRAISRGEPVLAEPGFPARIPAGGQPGSVAVATPAHRTPTRPRCCTFPIGPWSSPVTSPTTCRAPVHPRRRPTAALRRIGCGAWTGLDRLHPPAPSVRRPTKTRTGPTTAAILTETRAVLQTRSGLPRTTSPEPPGGFPTNH